MKVEILNLTSGDKHALNILIFLLFDRKIFQETCTRCTLNLKKFSKWINKKGEKETNIGKDI